MLESLWLQLGELTDTQLLLVTLVVFALAEVFKIAAYFIGKATGEPWQPGKDVIGWVALAASVILSVAWSGATLAIPAFPGFSAPLAVLGWLLGLLTAVVEAGDTVFALTVIVYNTLLARLLDRLAISRAPLLRSVFAYRRKSV